MRESERVKKVAILDVMFKTIKYPVSFVRRTFTTEFTLRGGFAVSLTARLTFKIENQDDGLRFRDDMNKKDIVCERSVEFRDIELN